MEKVIIDELDKLSSKEFNDVKTKTERLLSGDIKNILSSDEKQAPGDITSFIQNSIQMKKDKE